MIYPEEQFLIPRLPRAHRTLKSKWMFLNLLRESIFSKLRMKILFTEQSWLNSKSISLLGLGILLFFFISANAQKDSTDFPEDDLFQQQGVDVLNDISYINTLLLKKIIFGKIS